MPNLDFDTMRLFLRVAELGTLSAVARERNVPVSLVSRALQRIETAYGVRLIHRSTHGLSLTPEGITFQRHCRQLTLSLDELDAEFARQSAEASGLVRVSSSAVIAEYLLVPSLAALQARHPKLRVELLVDDRMVDMAREGIDIAIRTGKPVSETLVMRRLGQLRRRLYASPQYLHDKGMPKSADELRQHQLITNSTHPSLNVWNLQDARGQHTLVADGPVRSDNTATLAAMALQGLGIARIVTVVGEPLVAQGRLVAVLPGQLDEGPVPLNAAMLAERHRLPKIKACNDHWADWLGAAKTA